MNIRKFTYTILAVLTFAAFPLESDAQIDIPSTKSIKNEIGKIGKGTSAASIVNGIIGNNIPSSKQIIGTWAYTAPGVAFTSKEVMSRIGGEVVAKKLKDKMYGQYNRLGLTEKNTKLTLNPNKIFNFLIKGVPVKGTYLYNEKNGLLNLRTTVATIPCYVKNSNNGMDFLFESKKLLTLIQNIASVSGNKELELIGRLSKTYDGVRVGFETKK